MPVVPWVHQPLAETGNSLRAGLSSPAMSVLWVLLLVGSVVVAAA